MIISIFFVSLLAISVVSAADNATEDIVGIEETTNDAVNVEEVTEIVGENKNQTINAKIDESDVSGDAINSNVVECDGENKLSARNPNGNEVLGTGSFFESGSYGYIESDDMIIVSPNKFKVQLVGSYISNQDVYFTVYDSDNFGKYVGDYVSKSDSNGYATLNRNLEWGHYWICISTDNHGSVYNSLTVRPNGYSYVQLSVSNAIQKEKYNYIECTWWGILNGYLKIYKGNKLVKKVSLKTHYSNDNEVGFTWMGGEYISTKNFSPGKYAVKIVDSKGKVVAKKTFKIFTKGSSKIKVNSVYLKAGKKHTFKAYVKDYEDFKIKKGVVKFKINGKTYNAKVKNGVAKIRIKVPSKAKTYVGKAIFLGNKNFKKSSTKFKLIVPKTHNTKKKSSNYKIITTSAREYWITKYSGKFKVKTKIWDMTAGFRAPYKYIDTTLYKNGKQVYNSKYKVKYKIDGIWTGWVDYGTTSTAHHRYMVPDDASVDQIKVKVNRYVNSFI